MIILTKERTEDRIVCLRARALSVLVDTTCSVRCAWAMPVYMTVKVNSGEGKRDTSLYTDTIHGLAHMLGHSID